MKKKWNKSYYKCTITNYFFEIVFLIVLVGIIFLMYAFRESIQYNVLYISLNTFTMMYFIYRRCRITSKINRYRLKLTTYSNKLYKIHRYVLVAYSFMVVISDFVFVCFIHDTYYKIWIWYAIILPMLYSDSAHLSSITAFGNNYFLSGRYLVKYDDIEQIKELKECDTVSGKMVLVSFYSKGKEYGYDKLFLDEYHTLRLNVFQDNEVIKSNKESIT